MSFSFGTSNTLTNTTPSFSFGNSNPTAGTNLNFGSSATGSTGLQFNTPTTGSTGLQFNSPAASQSNTGLTLGTPANTTTSNNFGFGSTPGALSFGTPSAAPSNAFGSKPSGTLGFGITPQTTQSTLGTGLFGNTTQAPNTTTQPLLNFGATPTVQPACTTTGSGLNLATVKPTLLFGSPATSTAATTGTGIFNLGTAKTTAATSTGFTLSTGTTGIGNPLAPSSTAPTPFKGLGGVDSSQNITGSGNQSEVKCGKEIVVPNEILQNIENFKNFVKQQKVLAGEVSRSTIKPIKKVTEDSEALRQLLGSINTVQQKNRTLSNKLKLDTSTCFSQYEMAQRTHDTPFGLQNDNIAPIEFFIKLGSKFEKDVSDLRQEIDNTEKHVKSLSNSSFLTPPELSLTLKRLHDSFVALAGRLQTVHSQVIAQKEKYLNMCKEINKDTTNVFGPSKKEKFPSRSQFQSTVSPGPTPFSSIGRSINLQSFEENYLSSFQSNNQLSASPWNLNSSSTLMSNTQNSLQSPIMNSSLGSDNQNFQLLKPPIGNKRGKR